MKTLSLVVLVKGSGRYSIERWKPSKGRSYYQLSKFSVKENDYIYTNKNFTSIKKAKEYLKGLEKIGGTRYDLRTSQKNIGIIRKGHGAFRPFYT